MRTKNLIKSFDVFLRRLGLNVRVIAGYRHLPRYLSELKKWRKLGGDVTNIFMVLSDYGDGAGTARGHYFHQDLLVARFIHADNPQRHVDVGSRVDGFVAHVAAFRKIEVIDIRPLKPSEHKSIVFTQADLMESQEIGLSDSVSCLHALEHFGLGRYSDDVDPEGHIKGLDNLVALVADQGRLYIGVPIGKRDEVHFNAHRVFDPRSLPELVCKGNRMKLLRFDFVDDLGALFQDARLEDAIGAVEYGCGIYTFEKVCQYAA
jgi:hypothetical protein